jgi:Chromate transport protein ChrA
MNFYWQLFFSFAKIGAFTIGGGYAMLPLIQKEVVEKKHWIDQSGFLDMIAISQSLPGILAVNISILIGHKLKGNIGSIIATLGSALPSFVIMLLIAIFFRHFNENIYVVKIFKAIRPAVVALIAIPVFSLAKEAGITVKTIIMPIAAALLIWIWGVSPIYIILAAIVGGLINGYSKRRKEKQPRS